MKHPGPKRSKHPVQLGVRLPPCWMRSCAWLRTMTDDALVPTLQHTWIKGLVHKEKLTDWLNQESIVHVQGIHKEGNPGSHGRWEITVKNVKGTFAVYYSYGDDNHPESLTHTIVRGNRGWKNPDNLALRSKVTTAIQYWIIEDMRKASKKRRWPTSWSESRCSLGNSYA